MPFALCLSPKLRAMFRFVSLDTLKVASILHLNFSQRQAQRFAETASLDTRTLLNFDIGFGLEEDVPAKARYFDHEGGIREESSKDSLEATLCDESQTARDKLFCFPSRILDPPPLLDDADETVLTGNVGALPMPAPGCSVPLTPPPAHYERRRAFSTSVVEYIEPDDSSSKDKFPYIRPRLEPLRFPF
ncbi:hypothetical protein EVG20_g2976 [Dentipellis fragilis]|uniref:Uncharacterized protein n=1 Tax=Dentipellis fragilis TaxID=205917 RepID=A0A4Y9Z5S6_9AGAM|nr:hypothetical protein EVG20_g2976 [Dentipellis fragilis]